MERRIVFFGRTGSGKSATGNNILGQKMFKSTACGSSVTGQCHREVGTINGRKVQIIDTPGLFDTKMIPEDVTKEIMKCLVMTAPGPHAFVLVIGIGRITEEEQKTVTYFQQIFGERMLNYLIILFTRKDDLQYDNITLEMYLKEVPEKLADLVKACRNRCIAFNNRGTADERAQDKKTFLDLVDRVVLENSGKCYTDEKFQEVEKIIKAGEEQMRKVLEEQGRKRIEKEVKLKFKLQQHQNPLQIKNELDMGYKELEKTVDEELTRYRENVRQSGSVVDRVMKSNTATIIGGAVAAIGAVVAIAFAVSK